MSAVACDLYRIKAKKKDAMRVLLNLNLAGTFEPVTPLFPIKSDAFAPMILSLKEQISVLQTVLNTCPIANNGSTNSRKLVINSQLVAKIENHKTELQGAVSHINNLIQDKQELEKKILHLTEQVNHLKKIKHINHPIFQKQDLVKVSSFILNNDHVAGLQSRLKEFDHIDFQYYKLDEDQALGVLVYDKNIESTIESLIEFHAQHSISTPIDSDAHSPQQAYKDLDHQIKLLLNKITSIDTKIGKLIKPVKSDLLAWHDILKLKLSLLNQTKYIGYHVGSSNLRNLDSNDQTDLINNSQSRNSILHSLENNNMPVQIDGWLDPHHYDQLNSRLKSISPDLSISKLDASDDPEVRTILKNNSILRPFELITSLMGTPHPSETDPSPYVAPFFILFFGFALGDAGYGLLLTFTSLYLLSRQTSSQKTKDAFTLILYCGLSTSIFGILTGSWFGADLQALGSIGLFLSQFKLLDLQTNLMLVLIASLIMGFLHQIFGLLLSIISHIKSKEYARALLDPGSWLLLLSSLVFWGAGNYNLLPPETTSVSLPLLWISLIYFAVGQGRDAKSNLLVPFVGLAKLFNLTSYLSNTLSYARLLALALATSVIASVINLLASMTLAFGPIGYIVSGIIIVIGHAFNITLNVMGTFINVARLHLVEFFPRFFEAKGIALSPIKAHPSYSTFASDVSGKNMKIAT